MDIFQIHSQIVADYKSYIRSFINIKDTAIREAVETELDRGRLWPEPLIQFNPAFEIFGGIGDVAKQEKLCPEFTDIFKGFKIYRHQVEAIRLGCAYKDFVVTSGTGSGKSLTYIGSIFQHLLKNPEPKGIRAVVVYPMNALINSQFEEFEKFKANYEESTGQKFPISYGQYTGQEKEEQRVKIRDEPPDILLTNYMMLELILTRIRERSIRNSIYSHLRFLVFDELHTYRGRQGADVAMLIRRIKSKCQGQVTCIGTSATMVSAGTIEQQKQAVAAVASKLFAKPFTTEQVVDETLVRSFNFDGQVPPQAKLVAAINAGIDQNAGQEALTNHPTAIWLESKVALVEREGKLVRNRPLRFSEIVGQLVEDSGLSVETCEQHLKALLAWITRINEQLADKRYTFLPFKLHQFFSQTGAVYTTLDQDEHRKITLEPAVYQADEANKKPIFPNVFSRGSGHAYICVCKNPATRKLEPREFRSTTEDDEEAADGYLIVGEDVWNPDEDLEMLPEGWVRETKHGALEPRKEYRRWLPSKIYFDELGNYSETDPMKFEAWFMPAPLLFDPTCGTFFDTKTKEGTKLTQLGYEGRSTSTTITAFSILTQLEAHGFPVRDQKLLSFTDNRQDAALQAGHFNDFLQVIHLRAGVCKALEQSPTKTLTYANLGEAIFKALNLPFTEYANREKEPEFPTVRRQYEETLQRYLVYRALYDLRRGWRLVLPNLEQCALLRIDYAGLQEVAETNEAWKNVPLLNELAPVARAELLGNVLDFFRLEYAIYSENYLTQTKLKEAEKEIRERLKSPWKLDEGEELHAPYFLRLDTLARFSKVFTKSMGPASTLGKYLRDYARKTNPALNLKGENYREFITALLEKLEAADFLKSRTAKSEAKKEVRIYQIRLDKIIWRAGDKTTVKPDVVKQRSYKEQQRKPNLFFQGIYLRDFSQSKRLRGEDHTGQLTADVRIQREDEFRDGRISALFCSPTMELGIDIRNLSVVHMRNAPPNPANYAQRGGRAGRSGQAALVFTYCSSYSNHDRHYFKHQPSLVAGAVVAPRLDLCNQELLSSHLNALFLSEVGLKELDESIRDLIDESKEDLPLTQTVKNALAVSDATFQNVKNAFKRAVHDFHGELSVNHSHWYSDQWIEQHLNHVVAHLDASLERWRRLYRAARATLTKATAAIESGKYTLGSQEYRREKRNQDQATRQLDLLRNTLSEKSRQLTEFYPYRYLASEAFLPGYNFTRLPLRTFVQTDDTGGEYISRPRAIALREFGPQNIIYYNGQKYEIRQLVVQDAESNLQEAKVSKQAGYFLTGDQKDLEICPFSGASLHDNANKEHLLDLIEMGETRAEKRDRISCEEEERVSRGFLIDTYFAVDPGNLDRVRKCLVKNDQEKFLNVRHVPAARLVYVNRRWRSRPADGFPMGLISGEWKRDAEVGAAESSEAVRRVKLFTTNTADALYIEPIKTLALAPEGVITLQYALKRAIENVFQIESNELGVVSMGDPEHPNILLFEAAEGSLGILSQFVEDPTIFRKVIEEAIKVCRFDEVDYKGPASYDDLLSYYNQRDHKIIDRHLIQDALQKLKVCEVELLTNPSFKNYEDHYQTLLHHLDPNSVTERKFLDYLHDHGLRLPDAAQKCVEGLYVQPDFYYHHNVWVFCDGTPHDDPAVKADDEQKRQSILNLGHEVFVYHYQDNLAERIASRPDIFKKVK